MSKCVYCGVKFGRPYELLCPDCMTKHVKKEIEMSKDFKKADNGKLNWDLMPFKQLEDVVKVLMNGAEKYEVDNWKKCDDTKRYRNALMRHVIAYKEGHKIDEISEGGDGLPHLAHAICNCLFLMWFDDLGQLPTA